MSLSLGRVQGQEYGAATMIVANQPGVETLFPTGYTFYAQKIRVLARP